MLSLLSEPLVLRTTRMLGDYADDKVLPHRLGDLSRARFTLLRLTDTRFFVADHPMTVSQVFVDDELTLSWEPALERDGKGHAWTVVKFSAPVDLQSVVSATGTGALDTVTGALLENPADLMAYVLRLSGRSTTFPDLRAEAAAEGLRLAGSIDSVRSTRAWLDEIALSAGAIWTPTTSRLYPTPTVVGSVIDLDFREASGLDDPRATLDDTADILRVSYDRADANGRHQHYIELTASPMLYGGVVAEVFFPWLRTPANAESVGRRVLPRMAGRRYAVGFESTRHDIRPGQWLRLVENPEWHLTGADPVVMTLAATIEPNARHSRINGETLLSVPMISVTGHSLALSDTSVGGADVTFREGVATFTIRADDGRPLPAVRVTLDGSLPKTTDERGLVSFVTVPGSHELLIEREGYATQRLEFKL